MTQAMVLLRALVDINHRWQQRILRRRRNGEAALVTVTATSAISPQHLAPSRKRRGGVLMLVALVNMVLASQPSCAEIIRGKIVSIGQLENLVWVRGEYCRSTRMCEGIIYGDVRVALQTGHVVILKRMVLLHPETTNCRTGDAYWAFSAVREAFSQDRRGTIEGHPYSRIAMGTLEAAPIDLTLATDRAMGFAADGPAHIGALELTVRFDTPFPEDVHVQSFCKEGVAGIIPTLVKTLHFGPLPQPSVQPRSEVARRSSAR
ncbi:MAG: hypothetical protein AB7F78_13520 [Hyphomicrobiaceae bacterium]